MVMGVEASLLRLLGSVTPAVVRAMELSRVNVWSPDWEQLTVKDSWMTLAMDDGRAGTAPGLEGSGVTVQSAGAERVAVRSASTGV
jgi:hypothetical protein